MHAEIDSLSSRQLVAAGVNALFRMKETRRRGLHILEDSFAVQLADERLLLQALGRFAVPPLSRALDELQTAHCVRHRAVDELMLRAVSDGFQQVVVLGGGFDMRASRFAERIANVRWYELDRAEILDKKQRRLGRTLVRPTEPAAFDPDQDPILEVLRPTSFDLESDTLFILEGLIHSLPLPRLEALIGECAKGRARRRLVMTFAAADAPTEPRLMFLQRLIDEVPQLQLGPSQLAALCASHKLQYFRSWPHEQQVLRFAPEAAGRAAAGPQEVALVESRR